jgi:molybdate transport system substrate-binding protein
MKPLKFLLKITACCLLLQSPLLRAEEITVAVAANFITAMRELAGDFEAQSGHKVTISSGSSGSLYAQIDNGAPFDIFFSADQEKPAALVSAGRADTDNLFTYAEGTLVLWSPDAGLAVENAAFLQQQPGQVRLATANPRLAPYGAAALQVLQVLEEQGITTAPLVISAANITQAYQFVETGNVTAGFIALSQVIDNGEIRRGAGWIIPQDMYDPIKQDGVLLNRGKDNDAAKSFLEFIQSEQAKTIISSYGYGTD